MAGYIQFENLETDGKTEVVKVTSKAKIDIGVIKWNDIWKRYVVEVNAGISLDERSLKDIADKIAELADKRVANINNTAKDTKRYFNYVFKSGNRKD